MFIVDFIAAQIVTTMQEIEVRHSTDDSKIQKQIGIYD
jgi:hypothetical protein